MLRSVPGRRRLALKLVGITGFFGWNLFIWLGASGVFREGGPGHAGVAAGALVIGSVYLAAAAGVLILAALRPTVTVSDAGIQQSTLWNELRARAGARTRPPVLILWPELQRLRIAVASSRGDAFACDFVLESSAAAIRIGLPWPRAAAIADAVLARRRGLEVEAPVHLILAVLREQGPRTVLARLRSAARSFILDHELYRRSFLGAPWWEVMRCSPALQRDFLASLSAALASSGARRPASEHNEAP